MAAKFGPGGNSESFKKVFRSTLFAPQYVNSLGLDCYEYEAGQGLSASPEQLLALGLKAKEFQVRMSFHTPYFISLSSTEPEKRDKSISYLFQSAQACEFLQANIMVVHTGSAAKIPRDLAMQYAADTLTRADQMLRTNGFHAILGLETMGKLNQLGTLDEVISLCKISDRFAPVVDFGHVNAREQGSLKTKDDFKRIFDRISSSLGASYAENLHCHFSKIEYTEKGEKRHLTFADTVFGPAYEPFLYAVDELGVSPTVISESDGTQTEDSLCMKQFYESLHQ